MDYPKTNKKWDMVKYHDDLAEVPWSLSAFEQDILACALVAARKRNTQTVIIKRDRLESMLGYKLHSERLDEQLKTMTDNLSRMRGHIEGEDKSVTFALFPAIGWDGTTKSIWLEISPHFTYLVNNFSERYVVMSLTDHLVLSTKYSKAIFRQLMRYVDTGQWYVPIEDFRRVIVVPKNYDGNKIMDKIVNPSVMEINEKLGKLFNGLTVEKVYDGTRIAALNFSFPRTPNYSILSSKESALGLLPYASEMSADLSDESDYGIAWTENTEDVPF